MNGSDDDDPFDPIVSGTPKNVFRRCPFVGERKSGDSDPESDSSDSEAVESTGIFMLSLSDSVEEKDDCTPPMSQTAPEELAPTGSDARRSVPADAIGAEVSAEYVYDGKAVDLGRDTDVWLYSEVQSTTETGEKDESIEIISVCKSHSSEAKKSGLSFDGSVVSLGESKKLRSSEEALGSSYCARTVVDKFPVDSTNSGGGSKLVPASSAGHNKGDENSSGGKCNVKEIDDGKVSDVETKSAEKEVKESVKNSQSHQQSKLQKEIASGHRSSSRVLPPSISGVKKNATGKKANTSEEDPPMETTLLDILKILKGEQECEIDDQTLSKLSILDIVQRRGMTFPRPEWWPPED